MLVGMIICLVFMVIYALVGIAEVVCLSFAFLFGILAIMFLLLGISPKKTKYMFGKHRGMRKGLFVLISILCAFTVFGISLGISIPMSEAARTEEKQNINNNNNDNNNEVVDNEKAGETIADVRNWYEKQTPNVSRSLMDYAKSVNGLTSVNVNSSRFCFGEDSGWYDCHYTISFTCVINGVTHNGEARGFLKYQDDSVEWFHFEIFSNDSLESVVEVYDDSYDEIIEDYYKYLEKTYG